MDPQENGGDCECICEKGRIDVGKRVDNEVDPEEKRKARKNVRI